MNGIELKGRLSISKTNDVEKIEKKEKKNLLIQSLIYKKVKVFDRSLLRAKEHNL